MDSLDSDFTLWNHYRLSRLETKIFGNRSLDLEETPLMLLSLMTSKEDWRVLKCFAERLARFHSDFTQWNRYWLSKFEAKNIWKRKPCLKKRTRAFPKCICIGKQIKARNFLNWQREKWLVLVAISPCEITINFRSLKVDICWKRKFCLKREDKSNPQMFSYWWAN